MTRRKLDRAFLCLAYSLSILVAASIAWADGPAPGEKSFDAPHSQTVSVKMIGPVTQTTDLQIICILKHDPSGDKYIEAMDDFNQKLHHLLSGLRDRGEFEGELGQTLLFTPPSDSITPKQVLLIGIGDESNITTEKLELVGGIAARETTRLKASQVSFAPTLRDQGSSRVDVGDGDAAFVKGWILAYDTEQRLQSQGLSPSLGITGLTIEAGPKFFEGAAAKVGDAIEKATALLHDRPSSSYMSN